MSDSKHDFSKQASRSASSKDARSATSMGLPMPPGLRPSPRTESTPKGTPERQPESPPPPPLGSASPAAIDSARNSAGTTLMTSAAQGASLQSALHGSAESKPAPRAGGIGAAVPASSESSAPPTALGSSNPAAPINPASAINPASIINAAAPIRPAAPMGLGPNPKAPPGKPVPEPDLNKRTLMGLPATMVEQGHPSSRPATAADAPSSVSGATARNKTSKPSRPTQGHRVLPQTALTRADGSQSEQPAGRPSRPPLGAALSSARGLRAPARLPASHTLPRKLDLRLQKAIDRRASLMAFDRLRPWHLVAVGLGAVAVSMAVAFWMLGRPSSLETRVVHRPEGDYLELRVSDKDVRSARVFDEDNQVVNGVARFALPWKTTRAGKQQVRVELVDRDGERKAHSVELDVDFLLHVDTNLAGAEPPQFRVEVKALRGTKLSMERQAIRLKGGRGSRTYPVTDWQTPVSDGAPWSRILPYTVERTDGRSVQGELKVDIPYTSVEILQPGLDVTTDEDSVTIKGKTSADAEVFIDGKKVPLRGILFTREVKLTHRGVERPMLIVSSPRKLPRVLTLQVRKVRSERLEAERFGAETLPAYSSILSTPEDFRGRRVSFLGTIYGMQRATEGTTFQVRSEACDGDAPCVFWVFLPSMTEFNEGDDVRVYGTLMGIQNYRSRRKGHSTMPRVDAAFVLDP